MASRVRISIPAPLPSPRRSHIFSAQCGLSPSEWRGLRRAGAPPILFVMLAFLVSNSLIRGGRDLDNVDFFAGMKAVSNTWNEHSFAAASYELLDDPQCQNFCSGPGLLFALMLTMRMRMGALSSWGTVCSSWIFVSSSVTKRTDENILGDTSCKGVADGNLQVSRMALLWELMKVRNGIFWLEQPGSSKMHLHPRMHQWMQQNPTYECRTWMGCFGGETPKPTILRSNRWYVTKMKRRMTEELRKSLSTTCTRTVHPITGRLECSGGKRLKESQVYPKQYAVEMFRLWHRYECGCGNVPPPERQHTDNNGPECFSSDSDSEDLELSNRDPWPDLDLVSIQNTMAETAATTNLRM